MELSFRNRYRVCMSCKYCYGCLPLFMKSNIAVTVCVGVQHIHGLFCAVKRNESALSVFWNVCARFLCNWNVLWNVSMLGVRFICVSKRVWNVFCRIERKMWIVGSMPCVESASCWVCDLQFCSIGRFRVGTYSVKHSSCSQCNFTRCSISH